MGPPLVLLPGTIGDERLFSRVQILLGDRFTSYAFDHLDPGSFTDVVDIFKIIIDHEINEKFHILGTSVGGWIAQFLAHRNPKLINSIIIANSFNDNSILRQENNFSYKISKFLPWFFLRSSIISHTRSSILMFDNAQENFDYLSQNITNLGKSRLRARLSWSLAEIDLPEISSKIPIGIFYTSDDPIVKFEVTEILLNKYPNAIITKFVTGGHFPYLVDPKLYATRILEFLSSI
jgi:pimeloyl-ACP methyl ester carboxylesterase